MRKLGKFHLASVVHEHVFAAYVTMHYTTIMHLFERYRYTIYCILTKVYRVPRSLAADFNKFRKRSACQMLIHQMKTLLMIINTQASYHKITRQVLHQPYLVRNLLAHCLILAIYDLHF